MERTGTPVTARAHTFRFDAIGASGARTRGVVRAGSADDARSQLSRRGLLLTDLRRDWLDFTRRSRPSPRDLAVGFRILADLIGAGLSVPRALHAFEDLAPTSWKVALPSMSEAVREGASLSDAIARAAIAVPPLLLGIIRAGEAGDGLAASLQRAATHAERTAEIRAAVRNALAYPALVAVTGTASIGLMLAVVIPRFSALLADLGQDLPASTRRMLAVAEFARVAMPFVVIAAVGAAIAFVWAERNERAGRMRGRLLLALPLIGDARRAMLDARVAHALGALLGSGVTVRAALRHAADSAGDREVAARVHAASDAVHRGEPLSRALESTNAVGDTTVRLLRSGEQTGRVAEMCDHAARMQQEQGDRAIRAAVRLIEPSVLILFAGVVGFVAVALLQAVYAVRPG